MDNSVIPLKKVRTANFSATEKQLLLSIICKHKDLIENKKTDGVSVDEKNKAWEAIAKEFNAACPDSRYRPMQSLKIFYNNRKMEVRKSVAEERKEKYTTGGGAYVVEDKSLEKELLLSIMNSKSVYGMDNPFDSNSVNTTMIKENDLIHVYSDMDEFEVVPTDDAPTSSGITRNIDWQTLSLVNCDSKTNHMQQNEVKSGWGTKEFKSTLLSTPKSVELKELQPATPKGVRPSSNRRRPTLVKQLTSSALAESYEILLSKRIAIADMEMKKLENELTWQAKQQQLQTESVELDILIKKATLSKLYNSK